MNNRSSFARDRPGGTTRRRPALHGAANGVEGERAEDAPERDRRRTKAPLTPAREVDALADMYDHKCTTMSLPGVERASAQRWPLQIALAETLLDRGAALEGPGTNPAVGRHDGAAVRLPPRPPGALHGVREPSATTLPVAAGLECLDDVKRLLPEAGAPTGTRRWRSQHSMDTPTWSSGCSTPAKTRRR